MLVVVSNHAHQTITFDNCKYGYKYQKKYENVKGGLGEGRLLKNLLPKQRETLQPNSRL